MSNKPSMYEVPTKQYLRSILDISEIIERVRRPPFCWACHNQYIPNKIPETEEQSNLQSNPISF